MEETVNSPQKQVCVEWLKKLDGITFDDGDYCHGVKIRDSELIETDSENESETYGFSVVLDLENKEDGRRFEELTYHIEADTSKVLEWDLLGIEPVNTAVPYRLLEDVKSYLRDRAVADPRAKQLLEELEG